MIVLAVLSAAAAVITVVLVRDHRAEVPRFAPPPPYHGCALPDHGTTDRSLVTSAPAET